MQGACQLNNLLFFNAVPEQGGEYIGAQYRQMGKSAAPLAGQRQGGPHNSTPSDQTSAFHPLWT
jgi:hypothetical protein